MRKLFLQCFMIIILFSLVSCSGESDAIYFDNAEYEPYIPSEPILPQEIIEDADDSTLPHLFAAALEEFIAGYNGDVRAYLATLDDDGTMGVLARPTTKVKVFDYWYDEYVYVLRHFGTLFFMHCGELLQADAPGFVAGRYNRLLSRFYGHTHIVEVIWKMENGRLETSTRLEYFSDAYIFYLINGWDNGFFDERNFDAALLDECDITTELIALREVRAEYAREKYGLVALPPPNFGHMHNTKDQTAQILAMTINCVPSLAATLYDYRQ